MKQRGFVARCLMMITQVSFTMITPILMCTFVGIWLDKHLGWHTTIVLIILGFMAGASSTYGLVKSLLKEQEETSNYDR